MIRRPTAALALPKHCLRQTIKGHTYVYVRINTGRRIRIHARPGTEAFTAEYARAIEELKGPVSTEHRQGTVHALATAFLASDYVKRLSAVQQERYRKRVERFAAAHGPRNVELFDATYIRAAMGEIASPHERTLWRQALSTMCRWGAEQHPPLISRNPFLDVPRVKLAESKPHRRWMPEHMATFRASYASGSIERRAFEFLVSTLARGRSDVSRMTRHNIRDGLISFVAKKNGVVMDGLPMSPQLKAEIDAVPATELVFFRAQNGKPLSGRGFSWIFRHACKAAGLPDDLTPHGLRHAGACEAAERGESPITIQKLLGDDSIDAAMGYWQQAEGVRMRREAHLRRWAE